MTTRWSPSVLTAALCVSTLGAQDSDDLVQPLRIWASSCAHVSTDAHAGRESLAHAIRQSEGRVDGVEGFEWDVWLDAGDLSGANRPPTDREGVELLRQYGSLTRHRREQIYHVQGNHDANFHDETTETWFERWADPLGSDTRASGVDPARRPFPVTGTPERYEFVAGNVLFLMLSDRNDVPAPVGRGPARLRAYGGFPAGAVTRATFDWWRQRVLDNQDKIIITMHHHALRDTTTGSGRGEGRRYHNDRSLDPGSSYLYYIIESEDADEFEFTPDAHVFEDFLAEFERQHGRGAIDLWIAGHTHVKSPDDETGGKSITETRWGVHFVQTGALTQHHGAVCPMSRILEFQPDSAEAVARAYLHEPYRDHAPGFYEPKMRRLPLRHAFSGVPRFEVGDVFRADIGLPGPESYYSRGLHAPKFVYTARAPDLGADWRARGADGPLELVDLLEAEAADRLSSEPRVVSTERGKALAFDGAQRLCFGKVETGAWKAISVCAWIKRSQDGDGSVRRTRRMRVVSKARIAEFGCFSLDVDGSAWEWQVYDSSVERWRVARIEDEDAEDAWRHVAGVVDPAAGTVRLYVDGVLRDETPWKADFLDDRTGADVVIGADSSELRFTHGFAGEVAAVHLAPRALSDSEIRELLESTRPM